MRRHILFFLVLLVVWNLFLFYEASGKDCLTGQEMDVNSALEYSEDMRAEIQQAQSKLAKAKEGDDLSTYTVTSKSVPNLKRQFKSLSECIKNIQENCRSSPVTQNLSSDHSKMETIMNELDRVSKSNLKSASQDQLNKLSLALDTLEQRLLEAENFIVQSGIEDLKKSLQGDIKDMKEEVKDAFDRLAKAKEGDDLYEICLTRKNLPNLKKHYDSLSEKVKEAKKNYRSSEEIETLSSDISKIGTILEELGRVAKANLKADSEAQLKKLSDSLESFETKLLDSRLMTV
ncbi:MAG: hypothetical protein OEY18_02480 [Candidatus Aminicenantes bacterium]|nr:hypothetical protein [Candidatus Aminicenantes bacterium]MDH5383549.1 hypothetical protein [Candidatus Aminicenantes bacterium]MDH5743442.1 hypothetical protein [Candidatus Aminicenantes bacterium]